MLNQNRILVLEDDKEWLITYRRLLSLLDIVFDEVKTLREARELLEKNVYDVVLLDMRLKEWDVENFEGAQLFPNVSEAAKRNGTQVILITAYGTIEIARIAFKQDHTFEFFEKQDSHRLIYEFSKVVEAAIKEAQKIRDSAS